MKKIIDKIMKENKNYCEMWYETSRKEQSIITNYYVDNLNPVIDKMKEEFGEDKVNKTSSAYGSVYLDVYYNNRMWKIRISDHPAGQYNSHSNFDICPALYTNATFKNIIGKIKRTSKKMWLGSNEKGTLI